ncbi:hypothetical protein ACWGH2_42150 [Streptomyces sp. NPDC054871]
MSENEQIGPERDGTKRPAGTGVNIGRAGEVEHPPASWRPAAPEQREGRVTRQEQPVPPGDRLAHLGHIEHPAEMYTFLQPVGNSLPVPDGIEEWAASFVLDTQRIEPGGDGKTSTRVAVTDLDPQGSGGRWELRPEIQGMQCGEPTAAGPCRAGIGEPAHGCPNPANHPQGQA